MKPVPHLNALRALEASVRLGSFKAAAGELGVTPAAVGQLVRKLEAALGRQLLVRHANGFAPNEYAQLASVRLASGFAELRSALALMTPKRDERRIHITVTPTIAERWLAPRLTAFMVQHGQVDLRIDTTPFTLYEVRDEFDFALRYHRPGASGHQEIRLFGETLIPVCTPEVATMLGSRKSPDCLANVPLIHVDRSTDDSEWYHWEEWGKKFGYRIPIEKSGRVQFAFTTMALRSLYDGHGMHLAQLSVTLPDLLSGRLVAPFGTSRCIRPGYHYSLIRMDPGNLTKTQRAFRDWVVSEGEETQKQMDQYFGQS